ncbi:MAG: DNA-directed RNA polymerase subunit alpha [Candidatus Buchananbacteria bacterium RIFCSPHIGHO2_01_FULL_44_11]|uniref:DNA-directed RNA polymerase subunit alpha n=1 Tax=Candidatus Buchananbacteria bacterium RIFCSPHIGHO2_01_FULL_44_11 TaxID=1797535 RepID=A0A1G1Y4G7_9BACT|nr:MAG: DNA-directed RNA polymerase subunit alpha [Candidatus Buchananbacteria bacterium RIFCSPHIGHO2_01_FULL_44_11]
MENISLPAKIEFKPTEKKNESVIMIQPCHPGFGTTLGNALRRVLLSSLPGAAVTAFKIKGVQHEFSAINNIKEDVVQISLNLKQLRVKVYSAEPVKLVLKAKGEKKATGKDIEPNASVEVINKDLVIANLTGKDAELEMELTVSQGRGYLTAENQDKDELEIGMIAIDSIFSPIVNVGFKIESVRVGQMTNYENLILTIETDGTISPDDALKQSADILINHFNFILNQNNKTADLAIDDKTSEELDEAKLAEKAAKKEAKKKEKEEKAKLTAAKKEAKKKEKEEKAKEEKE